MCDTGKRVLIVDDHPVVRHGLAALLAGQEWVAETVGAATAEEAIQTCRRTRIDVVAMDIGLPDGCGLAATRSILADHPDTAVLVLTMSGDDRAVAEALDSGARGYLLKDTDPALLLDALRTVAHGGFVLGPGVYERGLPDPNTAADPLSAPPFDVLTPRERCLLERIAQGRSNDRIARELGLQPKTVRNQVSVILAKLAVEDRFQAALLVRDAMARCPGLPRSGHRPGEPGVLPGR